MYRTHGTKRQEYSKTAEMEKDIADLSLDGISFYWWWHRQYISF